MPRPSFCTATAVVLTTLALLQSSTRADRDPSCDDHSELSSACGFALREPETEFFCSAGEILALKNGCFVCVNPASCLVPIGKNSEAPQFAGDSVNSEETKASVESPTPTLAPYPRQQDDEADASIGTRVVPDKIRIVPDHKQEELLMVEKPRPLLSLQDEQAQLAMTAGRQRGVATREVSNWFFVVPAFLALISVGIAVRARVERHREQFHRLHDQDQEEINPFCGECSPQQDSEDDEDDAEHEDLEYGAQGDSDDNAGECRVLPAAAT